MTLSGDHRNRRVLLGIRLQLALRLLLIAFAATTLALDPPGRALGVCVVIVGSYVALVGWWSDRAYAGLRGGERLSRPVVLAVLLADVVFVATLSVLTGVASPDSWTSDVLVRGLYVIPLLAAAQLSPAISATMAAPTLIAFLVSAWISKSGNQEPWSTIFLDAAVLAGLAGGSVALSFIQRARVFVINELLEQRTRLLDELLGFEKRERSQLSERLHDGALQCVLAARYDLREVRAGSAAAVDRVESALTESVHLLRDVVRELHPEVLNRSGLKAAFEQLAHGLDERASLTVDLDVDGWPDGVSTDIDHLLFSCARELTTNVVKHAGASVLRIELTLADGRAHLRVADDGVGMSDVDLSAVLEAGHIGLAAVQARVLAADGTFDLRSDEQGTEVTVRIPLERPM